MATAVLEQQKMTYEEYCNSLNISKKSGMTDEDLQFVS